MIIDAVDVLCADLGSPSQTCAVIASLLTYISARPSKYSLVALCFFSLPLRVRTITSRPSPDHSVSAWRSYSGSAPLSNAGTYRRASPCAPTTSRDRTAHTSTSCDPPRSLLARLFTPQFSYVGGGGDNVRTGRRITAPRWGDGDRSCNSRARRSWTEPGKGLARMAERFPVFIVRAGQPEADIRRRGQDWIRGVWATRLVHIGI